MFHSAALANLVDIYRENILEPREEILMAKREEEFYKFDSRWRGRGQRLGRRHVEEQAEDDFLSQEFLLHEDPSSEELGTDTEESPRNDDTSNITEFGTDHKCMSRKEENETNSVRQRRHSQSCEVLFTYADWLGYSPSCHAILTTYPRKQLSEVQQTLCEAGLTHDTALVLEEI
ncbi:UBX domain-containing protein 8 [Stylophora pistillata]|uniref:UBX domain-containing protein 8 n=1 Tax=Stylophora pistillata TaxID=50429 RepID=A0A2B4RB12_STYPI|nr:UBX domain-containing protein 8 [Stylophora pistillata]